jgi:hypothetical protein
MKIRFALAACILLPGSVFAQSAELEALKAQLPGRLINDPTRLDWAVFGPGAVSKSIKDSSIPGGGALQITVPKKGATNYEIGSNAPMTVAIKRGQTLVISFYARTLSADTPDGRGKIGVRFQRNAPPYPGFGDTTLDIGKDWKLYEVSAKSDNDFPKGEGVVNFQLSGAKQTVQIAQTIMVEGATSIVAKTTKTTTPAGPATPVLMPKLAAVGTLISDPTTQNWEIYGAGETHQRVEARGLPGDSALQFTISAAGKNPYDVGTTMPVTEAIKSGDIIIMAILARTISADTSDGLGRLGVRLQQNNAPYSGFGDHMLPIGPTWKLLQIKTQATIDIPKGQGGLSFHLAGAKQVIEVARAYVIRAPKP